MTHVPQTDSRIADSTGGWLLACDVDIINADKVDEFILATFSTAGKNNDEGTFKLQWRRAGGTFADVTSTSEIKWGTGTSLVDGNDVSNYSGCLTPNTSEENEGDNTATIGPTGRLLHSEIQWALGFGAGALNSQEYEFQLVGTSGDASGSAICSVSITTSSGATTYYINLNSDARIIDTYNVQLLSDGRIFDTYSVQLLSDAKILVLTTNSIQLYSDARIKDTYSETLLSDARAKASDSVQLLSISRIFDIYSVQLLSDAKIKVVTTNSINLNSDARIFNIYSVQLLSDASILGTATNSINLNSDARVKKAFYVQLLSNATIQEINSVQLLSDARVKAKVSIQLLSDARIFDTYSVQLLSDAKITSTLILMQG